MTSLGESQNSLVESVISMIKHTQEKLLKSTFEAFSEQSEKEKKNWLLYKTRIKISKEVLSPTKQFPLEVSHLS